MSAVAWDEEEVRSYRPPFLAALLVALALVAALGGWALFAQLDGAVVTQGVVLAESQRKTVESLEGGILLQLLVAPGDRVAAGEPVALLDATQERERLSSLAAERDALAFDAWRLAAEEAGARALDPLAAPPAAQGRADHVAAQVRLFDARLGAHEGQAASLRRQAAALAAQADASEGQARAAERQIASWAEERDRALSLVDAGAAAPQTLREIERTLAVLEGARDEHRALAAAAREDRARAEADLASSGQQRLAEAAQGLVDARRALASLDAEARALEDVLARRTLRAPQDGVVVEILTVTPGAVVGSGAPLMEIVPDGDTLVVQARLPPEAIDTVRPGRPARVRLTAFRRADAPVVDGEVSYVSADLLEDERDGSRFFEARVTLDPAGLAALPGVSLSSGMPVEVAITTGERRAGDYLLEPVLRRFRGAMREE